MFPGRWWDEPERKTTTSGTKGTEELCDPDSRYRIHLLGKVEPFHSEPRTQCASVCAALQAGTKWVSGVLPTDKALALQEITFVILGAHSVAICGMASCPHGLFKGYWHQVRIIKPETLWGSEPIPTFPDEPPKPIWKNCAYLSRIHSFIHSLLILLIIKNVKLA